MSAFIEFAGVALALYLWESTLWLPRKGGALRKRGKGRWHVLEADAFFTTRELGLTPLWPLVPDVGIAPCQEPPLIVDADGNLALIRDNRLISFYKPLTWNDLQPDGHHLIVDGVKIRISSHRCVDSLRRAKSRGMTPVAAVQQAWKNALSPSRSRWEWKKWKLISGPLRWYGALLTFGFWVGLPLVYVYRGSLATVVFALGLLGLMACIAGYLWWLGKRVYPGARSAFRMDAFLALVVPFHAMRAAEIASVHAMGSTHPVGLILSTGDFGNLWLARLARKVLYPLPHDEGNQAWCRAMRPLLARALADCGKDLEQFDAPPDHSDDEAAASYCPRCHGLYLAGVVSCKDCLELEVKPLVRGGSS
jgi:hypothetical protein